MIVTPPDNLILRLVLYANVLLFSIRIENWKAHIYMKLESQLIKNKLIGIVNDI